MARAAASVTGACIRGVEARPVTVEVSLANGIPSIGIVGMADAAVLEARSRIRCALRSSGFSVPRKSITVNLAPSDFRKTGSSLDLAIAVSILIASDQMPSTGSEEALVVGELGLDGSVRGVRGEAAYLVLARETGRFLVGPEGGGLPPLPGQPPRVIDRLSDVSVGLQGAGREPGHRPGPRILAGGQIDFRDIRGQEASKRALAVAAAGGLGLLMIGPPGSGKTMLARRVPTILPPIDPGELQEALCIHSVAGEDVEGILSGARPFRSPHHTISKAGLVGGGRPVRPGEASLAHGGVAFFDELAEFPGDVLQTLRQPLEDGYVAISRVDGTYRLPSRFQFLAASNPCPCGHLGDPSVPCRCSPGAIERYRSRLGGPLADRIEMVLDVARPDPDEVLRGEGGACSADLRDQVTAGREHSAWMLAREGPVDDPRGPSYLKRHLSREAGDRLLDSASSAHLSPRSMLRVLRIARAVADIDRRVTIAPSDIYEAMALRGRRDGL